MTAAMIAVVAIAGLASSAHAQQSVLFSSGAPDNDNGAHSDVAASVYQANTFTLTEPAAVIVYSVDWYGLYYNPAGGSVAPATDNFTVSFFNTSGGTPSTTPITTFAVGNSAVRTATGQSTDGFLPDYLYTYTLSTPLTLQVGTYSLGVNDATTAGSEWYWADSSESGGTDYQRTSPTGTFTEQTATLAMGVTGIATPEPGSLLLLAPIVAAASAGLIARRRRV